MKVANRQSFPGAHQVGIIAPSPLMQHQLQKIVLEAGFHVAVNVTAERLNTAFLTSETIRLWIVALQEDDRWAELLQKIVDVAVAPLVFHDAQVASQADDDFPRWSKRLRDKLVALTPAPQPPLQLPDIALPDQAHDSQPLRFELPHSAVAPTASLTSLWVLCASLGGPDAVKEFLDCLPATTPAAFLYAQHIDAGCCAALTSAVGRHTRLRVVGAEHGSQLTNGCVAVVPVDHEIRFSANHHILWQSTGWNGPYGPSHDQLLQNVAAKYGKYANAILFSGMGSDGAIGSSYITEQGGLVWGQSAQSCIESSMPDAAATVGTVSWRGSPRALAKQLLERLAAQQFSIA